MMTVIYSACPWAALTVFVLLGPFAANGLKAPQSPLAFAFVNVPLPPTADADAGALGDGPHKALARDRSGGGALLRNCRTLDPSRSHHNMTTRRMQRIKDSAFVQAPPVPVGGNRPIKVAFLMFVKDRVLNSDLWSSWLRAARQRGLPHRLIIHAYGLKQPGQAYDPAAFAQAEFREHLSPTWAASSWCQMWEPEQLLLKQALDDPAVTHLMLLSQDTLPVKSMSYIYKELEREQSTRMCGDDFWYSPWPRAETWWVMRRGDAELFRDHEETVRQHFLSECNEENAWYYPLRARRERWGETAAPLINRCVMFTDWKDGDHSCKLWSQLVDACPAGCRKLRALNHTESGYRHPVVFHEVTRAALQELLDSPFWFARKFSDGAVRRSELRAMARLLERHGTRPSEEMLRRARAFARRSSEPVVVRVADHTQLPANETQ